MQVAHVKKPATATFVNGGAVEASVEASVKTGPIE